MGSGPGNDIHGAGTGGSQRLRPIRRRGGPAVLLPALFFLLLTAPSAAVARTYGHIYHAVYLGNREPAIITFEIPGVHPLIGKEIEVELRGLEVPGIAGRCDREAQLAVQGRDIVRQILANARSIVLKEVGRGRAFRITAIVLADDLDIRQVLIARGLARQSGSGPPPDWCSP